MNKKRWIVETIAFSVIILLVFVCSFLVLFFSSRASFREEIQSHANIAERIFFGKDPDTTGKEIEQYFADDQYRVSIIVRSSDGYDILYDSRNMYLSEEEALEIEEQNISSFVTRESSYGYLMVYYTIRDKENPSYFIRVAIQESIAYQLSRDFLIYGSIVVFILLFFYVVYKISRYRTSIKPLSDQVERLSYVAGITLDGSVKDDLMLLSESIDDVSEKLQTRIDDLEKEKFKTSVVLDSIEQAFIVVNMDSRITLFNRKASDIFGYSRNDAIGKDYHILMTGDEFSKRVSEALEGRKNISFSIDISSRSYRCDIVSIDDSRLMDGKGICILLLDVTEEKKVAKVKTDFLSNASHELKTPLTAILGYQGMIQQGVASSDEEKKEYVDMTIKEAKRMKEIISDMLVITRLENGLQGENEDVEISALISDVLSQLYPSISARGINVIYYPIEFHIESSKKDINNIFLNILDNAVKYNKDGGSIEIVLDPEKGMVSISDTGIGIKKENLSRIFERFYRVDNSKTNWNTEGTGLGLSIVKHVVQNRGYRIDVESTFGIGTTFTIFFKD